MRCPFCAGIEDRVIDSRTSADGASIRRRRECQSCHRRYTTYERVEEVPRLVIKKDQRREPFNRTKVLQGLLKACEKRPISVAQLEELVDKVERRIGEEFEFEVESRTVGQMLVEELKSLDQVAFVRFASVYQEFADISEFIRELRPLMKDRLREEPESELLAELSRESERARQPGADEPSETADDEAVGDQRVDD
ncbi:MAG: transcriptional repressor NrdR [Planctomycetes bacterium]|nr:transcriptional repressor NrdR [Planctomycetota bacterium]